MKKIIFSTYFFLILISIHAETIERKILWRNSLQAVGQTKSNLFSDFEGAVKTSSDCIPAYIENIPLREDVSEVILINPKYSILSASVKEVKSQIPEVLDFKYHLFHSGKDLFLQIELIPFIKNESGLFRLNEFTLQLKTADKQLKGASVQRSWKTNSVLSSGKWVKIKASQRGVTKITYTDLTSWGFASPATVNVYGNGGYVLPKMNNEFFYDDLQQNSVWHSKDGSNNDCLFFYSTGTIEWKYDPEKKMFVHQQNYYSDDCYYFLSDVGSTKLVQDLAKPIDLPDKQVSEYDFYSFHEKDEKNVQNSGLIWYGDKHIPGSPPVTYPFNISGRIATDTTKIHVQSIGRSSEDSRMDLSLNGSLAGKMIFDAVRIADPEAVYARPSWLLIDTVFTGNLVLKTSYISSLDNSEAYIDFIEVNSRCKLELTGAQLSFRDYRGLRMIGTTNYQLGLATSGVKIWDVTDPLNTRSMQTELNGTQLKFTVETSDLHEFVAFNPAGNIPKAEKVIEDIQTQNLHAAAVPELLIISHPDFLSQANELAAFHREKDQMTVLVVTPEQIFNEFSSGLPDVAGIRNYIRMCYEKSSGDQRIKHVLLFGDGSFDNKNIRGKGFNFIPTYQSLESLSPTSSFVSDDFFVLLDDDEGESTGLEDLGIGRIPARSVGEAQAVVDKIKNYVLPETLGKWRNVVSLIGDDGDDNTHMEQAEEIADFINLNYPSFYTDKIYFDAYRQESSAGGSTYPDVNNAINERVKQGVLIMNYIGHANEEFLADEKVLDIPAIDQWTNINNLPIFVTATCEFSRFDADELSAGEHILFNPNGGGIGLFSTTRLVYSGDNFNLNKSFYDQVFKKDMNGNNLRMGEVMRLAKLNSNTGINKRNFTLFGDPALRLSYPLYSVKTETINGQSAENYSGKISALEKITITGKITDHNGHVIETFNGTIIPTVYDKALELKTLGNEDGQKMDFTVQNNIIYKGNASVVDGLFNFEFIVPKDISYSIDKGKIIYYAENGVTDAQGAFTDFLIGGSSSSIINDTQGPEIDLYMNKESFESGDEVGASPLMIAEVSDDSGVNTVGTGIGHDITAILDGDNSNIFVLNDYYQALKDSYKSGKIVFPMNDLEPGKHSLTLKVWDVVNNSSEATIEFVITSDFSIEEVKCYPNPATEYVYFSFTHNIPGELFSATIEIFDHSGKLIDKIEKQILSDEAETIPVRWPLAQSNMLLRNGMYFCRFTVTSSKGLTSAKTGKFIVMR